jgi:Putative DNA-binding domain
MDHVATSLDVLRRQLSASRRSAWVHAVVAPVNDDPARLLALQARVGPKPEGWQERTWNYEQCTFASGQVTSRRLAQWLKGGAQTLSLGTVRTTIEFPENAPYTCIHVPSLARYGNVQLPWPSFVHVPGFVNPGHINYPQEYLVGGDATPSFPAFGGAFNAFFYDQYVISGVGNPHINTASIHVVDSRARIRRVRVRPASIDLWLGGSALRDTVVELSGAEYRTTAKVEKPRILIPLPDGLPSDAWIWLKSGREWLDFRPLNEWGGVVSPDVEMELPRDPAAELSQLATRGEGPYLEYKERVPSTKHEKRSVFKTVVAFANGAGGTVVFGIEDDTKLIKGLLGKPSVERRRLTDLVRDLVTPSPRVSLEAGSIDGRNLLVLHVQPGGGTIHALTIDSNKPEYYVRRDGTTFYAKPEELRAIAAAVGALSTPNTVPRIRSRGFSRP